MAAGLVYHNLTTAAGVTFTVACWVPDTSAPDVGALPIHVITNSSGVPVDLAALIGEVQASPTANTLLDRVKTLAPTAGSDGSTTITAGGTAQDLFSAATPTNGCAIYNPDASEDLWISLSTTAVANGTGCIRIAANGGGYETPPNMKPFHAISIVGATTGHKFTAIKW